MKSKIVSLLALVLVACGALTPAEEAHVAQDGINLSVCAAEAHMCKSGTPKGASLAPCWEEFDACMREHGYIDAGPAPARPYVPAPFPTVTPLLPDPEDASASDAGLDAKEGG